MKIIGAVILSFSILENYGSAAPISVPGTANLWLAGMTNGATARRGDRAPNQSPVLVAGIEIKGGATFTFSASGKANHGAPNPLFGPDGEELISHYLGAENGIGDITAPFVSLIGVFLGPDAPAKSPAPPSLDFRDPADREFLALAPSLKQPFFIGKGSTRLGVVQQVIAPAGATRLFLGIMDEYAWYDNEGGFKVDVIKIPSSPPVVLPLHPALNPTARDAVAFIFKADPAHPLVESTSKTPVPFTTMPGPELHAFHAIELSWPSESGRLYQLQWSASPNAPEWINLGQVIPGSGHNISVFDSTRTHPAGFYRVRIVQ